MARFSQTRFGRFLHAAGDAVIRAREVQALSSLPDSVFEERGTTRDRELRKIMNR